MLDKLKSQRDKLNARINALEAKTKVEARKQDVRKKILIGSYYIDQAMKNNNLDSIKSIMDSYLTRNADRKLFELPKFSENK